MDNKIFKAILCSSESATQSLDDVDRNKLLQDEPLIFKSSAVFNALCTSLTKLLCYTVSKEAYQRYSVRTHVIEIIREWSRISSDFQNFYSFSSEDNTFKFLERILDKYLTEDVLDNCNAEEYLLQLASALIYMTTRHPSYIYYVEKVLVKLSKDELSPDGERLLLYALNRKTNLKFSLVILEELYISQKCKLVEEPLLKQFQNMNTELTNIDMHHSSNEDLIDHLLEVAISSSKVFYLICLFLKAFFVHLEYAPAALNFIDQTLKDIRIRAEGHGKDIIDLYPKNLQSIIILLQIEPSYHSETSRKSVLNMLRDVLEKSNDHALILISHFPIWLKPFEDYISKFTNF